MVTADEFARSLRGVAAFLNRRPDALCAFEISDRSFWRSFAAIALTLPPYVVELALTRRSLKLGISGPELLADPGIAVAVGLGHVAGFLALPLVMMIAARRWGFGAAVVPFVIVTNWVQVFGSFVLAVPGVLLLVGWETPSLAALFTVAFAVIVLHAQWFATRLTLGLGAGAAAAVTGIGLVLSLLSGLAVDALI